MATLAPRPSWAVPEGLRLHWPLAIGLAALVVPTLVSLASQAWSTEAAMHGPIILATGIWLLVRAWPEARMLARPGNPLMAGALIALGLAAYVFGRAFSFLFIEASALFAILLAVAYLYFGLATIRKLWFPILYFGFMIPWPGWVLDQLTGPLKNYVSISATKLLEWAGYPIAREGVTLYIAQYQLLVEDACAGLNSLISLTAISLFYIYILHNANWRYALLLMAWILPVALLANLVRVIILVLLTYHWSNEAAQGFLHSTAGLVMFVTALLGIFAIDVVMTPIRNWLGRSALQEHKA